MCLFLAFKLILSRGILHTHETIFVFEFRSRMSYKILKIFVLLWLEFPSPWTWVIPTISSQRSLNMSKVVNIPNNTIVLDELLPISINVDYIISGKVSAKVRNVNSRWQRQKISEYIGKCRKTSKKYKNNHFFSIF